jgi:mRNA-degrading endonuclease toxin of MazEF toxin-antitoxin module
MKRGEVWWVNFEPSIGGEIRKKCPAVIISNDAANKYLYFGNMSWIANPRRAIPRRSRWICNPPPFLSKQI